MKVCISVGGRFHAFYLAENLQRRGYLHKLVTSYPKFKVIPYGITPKKVSTVFSKEIVEKGYYRLTGRDFPSIYLHQWYDFWASRAIPLDADVYIIWSGFASQTIARIRKHNPTATVILERCSTHIQFQYDILARAYQYLPELRPRLPMLGIIDKELREYAEADFVAVPTTFVAQTFLDKGFPAEKLLINPYGVGLQEFGVSPNKKKTKEDIVVIFVGSFSARKGAKTFLEVVDAFKNEGLVSFQLVGSIEPGLERALAPYLGKTLFFQPNVPQGELNQFYAKADLFLFPSYEEGMAYVTLQAMACGLVLLASQNSGAGMVVEDGKSGFLIAPEDTQGYVDTIKLLLQDSTQRACIGNAARQRVEKGFTWEAYCQRYVDVLEQLVGQKSPDFKE